MERDRVRALAHRIILWLLVAAAIGTVAYSTLADVSLRGPLAPVLVGVLAVHWMMPLWVAALRVQDEPVDDQSVYHELIHDEPVDGLNDAH
ncbi:hypothetical protein ACFV0D_06835 [Streptomyces sp. NPDC059556]|uniref:hypothetical protein n=1 Tax=Streptomyces sp. NPDC059556 TaxID=3346863 RepID=UPI003689DB75